MSEKVASVGSEVLQKLANWFAGGEEKVKPNATQRMVGHEFTGEALDSAGVSQQERKQAVKEGFLERGGAGYIVTKTASTYKRRLMSNRGKRKATPTEYDHDTGGWLLTSDLGESGHSPAIDDDQQPIKNSAGVGTLANPPGIASAVSAMDSVASAVASIDPVIARRLKALSREASSRIAFGLPGAMGAPPGASAPSMVPATPSASPEDLYSTSVFNREDEAGCGPAIDENQTRKFTHEVWGTEPANESQLGPRSRPERMQGAQGQTGRPSNLPEDTHLGMAASKRRANPCPHPEFVEKLAKAARKVKDLGQARYKEHEHAFHKAEKAIEQAIRQASGRLAKKCAECGKSMGRCECGSGKTAAKRRANPEQGSQIPLGRDGRPLLGPAFQNQFQQNPATQTSPTAQPTLKPTGQQLPQMPVGRDGKPLLGQAFQNQFQQNPATQTSPTAQPTLKPTGQQATNNTTIGQAPPPPGPTGNLGAVQQGVSQVVSQTAPQGQVVGSRRRASTQSPWEVLKKSIKRTASGGGRWGKGEWEVHSGDYGRTLDLNVNTRLDDGTPLVASTVTFSLVKEDKKGRTATVEVHDAVLHHNTRELRIPLSKAKVFAQEWARNTERVAKSCLRSE